jgi:hypothetical protein
MQPKLFLASISVFLFLPSSAQFAKGTVMPGAAIATGYMSSGETHFSGTNQLSSTISNTNTSISLSPSVGWFMNSNTVAGGSVFLLYNSQKLRQGSGGITNKKDNTKNMDLGLGGFIRYYLNTKSSLRPFAHAYLNGGSGSSEIDGVYYTSGFGGTDKSSYEGNSSGRFFYNAGVNAGVTKMLNEHIGLEAFLGYGFSHTQVSNHVTQVTDYGNAGTPDTTSEYETKQDFNGNALNIGIGFQLFLARRK